MVNVGSYITWSGEVVSANDREVITPEGRAAVKAMTPTKDWVENLLASVEVDKPPVQQANQEEKSDEFNN